MERSRIVSKSAVLVILSVIATLALAAQAAVASAPQSTLDPAGPVAKMQLDLFNVTLWVVIFIFVVVGGALLYAIIRFRGRLDDAEPAQIHGNTKLEIIWTVIPIILLIIIAIPTVNLSFDLAAAPAGETVRVRVIGHQWWWEMEYPDLGIVTANELRIPVGVPVELTLESEDVIHSFWVPRLAGKMDLVPNRTNTMWLQADEPGVYYGQCAEYCGTSHANMRLRVQALPRAEFDAWVQSRLDTQLVLDDALAARGRDVFVSTACAACHTVDGTTASGRVGPDLSDIGSRTTIAAGMIDNTPANLAEWIRDPQAIKPGALMPALNLSSDDVQALAAFLSALK